MRIAICLLALALIAASAAHAGPPPRVAAEAYLVVNATTGEVLARHDDAQRVPIASITKLMTALVALERLAEDEIATVSARAASVGGATAGLHVGQRVSVRDLVRASLVASANDATYALAEHAGGTVERFVALMNRRARTLGLTDSHFANPHGLDAPGHLSSARDVTKLARVAMRRTLIRQTVDDRSVTIGGRQYATWNDLLRFSHVFGVKTGHTSAAGWCQVAAFRADHGFTIYATLLGSPTREQRNADLSALLTWGLDRYTYRLVIFPGRTYARAVTAYGQPEVRLVAAESRLVLVHVGHALRQVVVAPAAVALPVRKGDRLGEVRVYDGKKLVAKQPLIAGETIEKPAALGRAGWYAERAAARVWGWIT